MTTKGLFQIPNLCTAPGPTISFVDLVETQFRVRVVRLGSLTSMSNDTPPRH